MGVMDERPPVQIPGQQQATNPVQVLAQIVQAMAKNPAAMRGMPQLPQGGGTPGQVGGAPPNMGGGPMGGSPGGPLPTNPAAYTGQAKGPGAYPVSPHPAFATGFEFRTRAGRNAAVVAGTMQGISDAVQRQKQQTWDKKKQEAEQAAASVIFKRQQAAEAQQRGDKEAAQRFQQEAEALMKDKKVAKVFQKGTEDYNSPEYLGIQGAYKAAMDKVGAEQAAEFNQAKIENQKQEAAYHKQKAWEASPPGIEAKAQADIKVEQAKTEILAKKVVRVEDRKDAEGKWHRRGYNAFGALVQDDIVEPKGTEADIIKTTTDPYGNVTQSVTTKGGASAPVPSAKLSGPDRQYLRPTAPRSGARPGTVVDPAITRWALMDAAGFKLDKVPTGAMHSITMEQNRLGLAPGTKPSGAAQTQASAARALVGYPNLGQEGLIDTTIKDIKTAAGDKSPEAVKERARLAKISDEVLQEVGPDAPAETFISRWKARVQQEGGLLDPQMQRIDAGLTSIYAFAGSMHGWRALKVAQEFKTSYGGMTSRPDAVIAALDGPMRQTAELRLAAGDPQYRLELMQKQGFIDKALTTGNVNLGTPTGGATPSGQPPKKTPEVVFEGDKMIIR